jgi:uracil-DNA glycosylase
MTRTLKIITEARRCTLCADELPLPPRPLLQGSKQSRILIIGQAPGAKTHASGIPWDDASGQRLRDWLKLTDEQFYDDSIIALVPMGLCYPGTKKSKGESGKASGGGDLAPMPICAPTWHPKLIKAMPAVKLTVLIGRYAIDRYLPGQYKTITDAVRDHKSLLPNRIVLPHPSPRNNIWLKKNDWFTRQTLPALRRRVRGALEA